MLAEGPDPPPLHAAGGPPRVCVLPGAVSPYPGAVGGAVAAAQNLPHVSQTAVLCLHISGHAGLLIRLQ